MFTRCWRPLTILKKYLLRCVDPYDVQVAEIDALLVLERCAGTAFGPHMAPLVDGGGSERVSGGGRQDCNYSVGNKTQSTSY